MKLIVLPNLLQTFFFFNFSDSIMGDSDHETDDITIPRAAMNKMIKELCPQIRVANEAR